MISIGNLSMKDIFIEIGQDIGKVVDEIVVEKFL